MGGCDNDFPYYRYLIELSKTVEGFMRKKIQWGVFFAANSLIYANDLINAAKEAANLLKDVLL